MRRIIVMSGGGTGSTFLIKRLRKMGHTVHARPDVCLEWKGLRGPLPSMSAHNPVWPCIAKEFKRRTGFRALWGESLESLFIRYLDQLDDVVVFNGNICQIEGMNEALTEAYCDSICVILRDPVQGYMSWFGRRHPEMAESHGGYATVASAQWYRNYWQNVYDLGDVCEALIWYDDPSSIPDIGWPELDGAFVGFKPRKRECTLPTQVVKTLRGTL